MQIEIITIFPELFPAFLSTSLVGRACERGLLKVGVHDLRSFTDDPHRTVDDEPYGGGGGMVMTAEPWIRAVGEIASRAPAWRVLLSPQGQRLTDEKLLELGRHEALILLCGRYEGIDERVGRTVVDEEISIGDFVLSGGEVAAMVVVEALSRQIPGVVGLAQSVDQDSFRHGLLDYPHYTRPRRVESIEVPEVLVSGDHSAIRRWRLREALKATLEKRPDLLATADLDEEQLAVLTEVAAEKGMPADKIEKLVKSGSSSHN